MNSPHDHRHCRSGQIRRADQRNNSSSQSDGFDARGSAGSQGVVPARSSPFRFSSAVSRASRLKLLPPLLAFKQTNLFAVEDCLQAVQQNHVAIVVACSYFRPAAVVNGTRDVCCPVAPSLQSSSPGSCPSALGIRKPRLDRRDHLREEKVKGKKRDVTRNDNFLLSRIR